MRSIWITMQNCASREDSWLSVTLTFGIMFHVRVRPEFRFGQRANIIKRYKNGNLIGDDNEVSYCLDLVVGEYRE